MAAAGAERPKAKDGENDFAFKEGEHAPPSENLTKLLHNYVPHDKDSFERLIKPSLKQQAQALDVAKVAMVGLDKVMAFLTQRRRTCGQQIEDDEAEVAFIEKEVAKQQAMVDKIKKHHGQCKTERDFMQKGLKDAIDTMQESVHYCHRMTQKTNSSIARLTKTTVPKPMENYLKSGLQERAGLNETNKHRNSTTMSKTGAGIVFSRGAATHR